MKPQYDIAGVLAGLFGGLGQGMDDVRRQQTLRTEADQRQQRINLEQKQEERIAGQTDLNNLIQRLSLIDPETEVEADLIGEASKHGLAGMFMKDPQTGVFKRRMTQTEQMKLAEQKAQTARANVQLKDAEMDLGAQQQLMDPNLGQTLMGMPMEQRAIYLLQRGFKGDTPTTLDEERQRAMVNPSVISAQIYGQNRQAGIVTPKAVAEKARQMFIDEHPAQFGTKVSFTPQDLAPYLPKAQALLTGQALPVDAQPAADTSVVAPQTSWMEKLGNLFGRQGWQGPQTQQPQAQAQPSGGVTFTLAEIQQQAQEDGVPVETVIKQVKDAGYTIVK